MSYLCCYHRGCTDGFGGALAFLLWTKRYQIPRENVEFKAVQYGEEAPDVTGKDVFIVDFSYLRDDLLKMYEQAASIIVLDHHVSAQVDLEGLEFAHFDMGKSGCVLAWEFLFPGVLVPELFAYLQDRDLWQWILPYSREINAAIRSFPFDFEIWTGFLEYPNWMDELKTQGSAIVRYQDQQIDLACRQAELVTIGGYQVPCVNTAHLVSETLHKLAEGWPFAAAYYDVKGGKRVFNLRSNEGGVDVSEIAKLYGGGGHARAAGFTIRRGSPIDNLEVK